MLQKGNLSRAAKPCRSRREAFRGPRNLVAPEEEPFASREIIPASALLVANRLDRVKLCGLLRGIPSEENSGRGTNEERKQHAPRLDVYGEVRHVVHHQSRAYAENDTNQPARYADEDGFDKELRQDIDALCANTHTKTYLARAFRHRDVHDVHNPDTAHEERNTRYRSQQHRHHVCSTRQHRTQLLLATNGEIILVGRVQLMVAAEYLGNLLDSLVGIFLLQRRAIDTLQVRDGKDFLLHGRIRCEDKVILVHPHAVVSLAFQDTYDAEGEFLEANHLPNRILTIREQIIDHSLSHYAYLGSREDVLFGKHIAILYFILPDFHIIRRDAIDRRRGIIRAVNRLPAAID